MPGAHEGIKTVDLLYKSCIAKRALSGQNGQISPIFHSGTVIA